MMVTFPNIHFQDALSIVQVTFLLVLKCYLYPEGTYSTFLLCPGDIFQDLQWMPETKDSTKPYIDCFFLHIHTFHLKEALHGFSLAYLNVNITTLALWSHG